MDEARGMITQQGPLTAVAAKEMARYYEGVHEQMLLAWLASIASSGKRYRHVKRGTTYRVLPVPVKLQVAAHHALDMADLVIYQSEADNSLWVRTYSEFHDGRFEEVL